MAEKYLRDEKVDMLIIYGETQRNATRAQTLYGQRYPERRQPPRNYFARLEHQFRTEPDIEIEERFIVDEETEINVLALVHVDPTISVRQIEHELPVSKESARKILKKHGYRSYKYQLHQFLYENDYQRRITFCNWLQLRQLRNENFIKNILFTDESRFTNLGLFNRNNTRYWAIENPHIMRQGRFQERFGFNVWLGVLGDHIIGPIIFDGTLTGPRYLEFLQNIIVPQINQIPNTNIDEVYFQQDGAGPHNAIIVRDYLNQLFPDRWIGTHGPVRWPARSPDLTPLDFFIWAHLKNRVYMTAPTTRQDLEERVRHEIAQITPQQLQNVRRATISRATLCINQNGEQFEQFL